jgi:drug/metabolite transporter (DMT)-like permease
MTVMMNVHGDHATSNFRAIVAMLVGQASFTFNDALMKLAVASLPGGQAIFLRGVMAVLVSLAVYAVVGGFKREQLRGQARILTLRNIGEIGSTFFFLFALFHMPIATAVAILQLMPLAITAAAALFLAEPVGWRRWLAAFVGLIGVMIVIRPGGDDFNAWSLLALTAVAFSVLRDLSTRHIGFHVPAILLVTISALTVTTSAAGFALVETWIIPTQRQLLLLLGAAVFLISGYYFMVHAMRHGEVAVVSPFRYSVIVWAILAGVILWGEWPDAPALVGTGVVVAAGLYTFMRERKVWRSRQGRVREYEARHGA